jgi:tryptophan synthase alpha chain
MNRIEETFHQKQPFIGFVVGGDGGTEYCTECCLELIAGGVDILEIGFPFSDPVADGPTIAEAAKRALQEGCHASTLLQIAKNIRKKSDIPLILFSYYNPLLQQGEAYLNKLKDAGYDAILVVDLPPPIGEPHHPYFTALKKAHLIPIFLVTPSTSDTRVEQIAKISQGFIYYVCQKGTTGVRNTLPSDVSFHIQRIKKHTSTPVAVGFGISTRDHAQAVLQKGEGFIVGSAFVKLMEKKSPPIELQHLAKSLDPRSKR